MIELLTASGSAPFTVALLVMLGLLLFELVSLISGLGVNEIFDDLVTGNIDLPEAPGAQAGDLPSGIEGSAPADAGGSLIGRVLAWLYVGRVPVLIILVLFLGTFGIIGLAGQSIVLQLTGMSIPAVIAAPAAFFASLPFVRWTAAGLARILPKDESNAVSTRHFVGRTATVVGGDARAELPSQARFRDEHGTTHYVMVAPEDDDQVLSNGSLVLLVRQINGHFVAIPNPNAALNDGD